MFPLLIVLLVTLIKDAYEDFRRHKSDREINNYTCRVVLQNGDVEERIWSALRPSDVVVLEADESLPADIVVLATSNTDGMCYVSTMNLDGETNLKLKRALNCFSSLARSVKSLDIGNSVVMA